MEDNAILKLSQKKNKNAVKLKLETDKAQVQTQLVDSMTQRLNINDKQSELVLPNSPENSKSNNNNSRADINEAKSNGSKSVNSKSNVSNSKNSKKSKSVDNDNTPAQTPISQSKMNNIIFYNENYGEPAVENNANNLDNLYNSNINNQSVPVVNNLDNAGTVPIAVDCPFCNSSIQSKTDSKCNGLVVFLFILMIIVFPIMCIASIYKAGTGTSRCCYCYGSDEECCDCCNDVTHICPKCGKVIAESDSCSRLFSCI